MGIIQEVGLLMKEEIRAYWLIQLTKKKKVSMIFNQIANGKGKIAIVSISRVFDVAISLELIGILD